MTQQTPGNSEKGSPLRLVGWTVAIVFTVIVGTQCKEQPVADSRPTTMPSSLKVAMDAIGCVTEQDFDDWAKARTQNDQASASAIQLARCRWLLPNEAATLIERRFNGNVLLLYRGERLWTHKAAVGL